MAYVNRTHESFVLFSLFFWDFSQCRLPTKPSSGAVATLPPCPHETVIALAAAVSTHAPLLRRPPSWREGSRGPGGDGGAWGERQAPLIAGPNQFHFHQPPLPLPLPLPLTPPHPRARAHGRRPPPLMGESPPPANGKCPCGRGRPRICSCSHHLPRPPRLLATDGPPLVSGNGAGLRSPRRLDKAPASLAAASPIRASRIDRGATRHRRARASDGARGSALCTGHGTGVRSEPLLRPASAERPRSSLPPSFLRLANYDQCRG